MRQLNLAEVVSQKRGPYVTRRGSSRETRTSLYWGHPATVEKGRIWARQDGAGRGVPTEISAFSERARPGGHDPVQRPPDMDSGWVGRGAPMSIGRWIERALVARRAVDGVG